jgi:hypothetical protein
MWLQFFPKDFSTAYTILNYSYALLPFVFLSLNILLCLHYKLKQLISPLILSWYLGFLAAACLSVNCTASTLSYFWMIFILILKQEPRKWFENILILVLYAALAFSYDMALATLPVLILAHIYNLYLHRKKQLFTELFFLLVSLICTGWYILRIYEVLNNKEQNRSTEFGYHFFGSSNPFGLFLLFVCIIYAFNQIVSLLNPKTKKLLFAFSLAAIFINLIVFLNKYPIFDFFTVVFSRSNRYYALPVVAFFSFCGLFSLFKKPKDVLLYFKFNNMLLIVIGMLCIITDFSNSLTWKINYDLLKKIPTHSGCNYLPADWFDGVVNAGVIRYHNTVLLQNSFNIDRVSFFKKEELELCKDKIKLTENFIRTTRYLLPKEKNILMESNFDYSLFINAPDKF